MDSVSQLVLGAAVGIAVMGKRVPVWKAALAGRCAEPCRISTCFMTTVTLSAI